MYAVVFSNVWIDLWSFAKQVVLVGHSGATGAVLHVMGSMANARRQSEPKNWQTANTLNSLKA